MYGTRDIPQHCVTPQAEELKAELVQRFAECGLELHPIKTRIIYCQDSNRRGKHEHISFDFLGHGFRPRLSMNKAGRYFVSFAPAVSSSAQRAMRETMHEWRLARRTDTTWKR